MMMKALQIKVENYPIIPMYLFIKLLIILLIQLVISESKQILLYLQKVWQDIGRKRANPALQIVELLFKKMLGDCITFEKLKYRGESRCGFGLVV